MTIADIRNHIDSIDDQIIGLLKQRVGYVKQVGELKKETSASQSFIRAGREAKMLRELIKKSDGVFPPAAIATIWRMVISASLSIEQNIELYAFESKDKSCLWLAREYFGAFMPTHSSDDIEDVIRNIAGNPAAVGVLPLADNTQKPWWVRPKVESNSVYVFARIPFIEQNPSFAAPVLAIANTCPEPTGDDITLLAVITEAGKDTLARILQHKGVEATILFESGSHDFLVEVKRFIPIGDTLIQELAEELGGGSVVRLLGTYAVPVRI